MLSPHCASNVINLRWDIFNLVENLHSSGTSVVKAGGEELTFRQPTIIRDAHPSPRIFSSVETMMSMRHSFHSMDPPASAGSPHILHETGTVRATVRTPGHQGCCCHTLTGVVTERPDDMDDIMAGTSLEKPLGREEAAAKVIELTRILKKKWRIPLTRVALCGFSQGAMLTLDVLHTLPRPPAMAAIFSGAPMCVDIWKARQEQWSSAVRREFLSTLR